MIKYKWFGCSTPLHIFYCVNILISLVLGLVVYVCYRPDTYVSQLVYNILGVSDEGINFTLVLPEWLLLFIRNYLADMCWAYALTFSICYFWLGTGGRMVPALSIAMTFELGVEVSQRSSIIPGTFDWWDIFLEICITAFVMLLIKTKHKEMQT